jgi:hypothetical protein
MGFGKLLQRMLKSQYERKVHNPSVEEECSKFVDRGKQAKLQWLRDRKESNAGNLNNVRGDTNRYFRNKNMEYLKGKINGLEEKP